MRFYKVREEILKGKNIAELPLRVTFYARVSTETDEQLNSLDNQISFFENFIGSPIWIELPCLLWAKASGITFILSRFSITFLIMEESPAWNLYLSG